MEKIIDQKYPSMFRNIVTLDILKIVNLSPFSFDPSFPREEEKIYRFDCIYHWDFEVPLDSVTTKILDFSNKRPEILEKYKMLALTPPLSRKAGEGDWRILTDNFDRSYPSVRFPSLQTQKTSPSPRSAWGRELKGGSLSLKPWKIQDDKLQAVFID